MTPPRIAETVREAGFRRNVTIATKIPPKNREWPARHDAPIRDVFPKDWIIACTEKSLKNLDCDFLDLQQLHVWSPRWLAETEWIDTLRELQLAGKIRYLGVSLNDHEPDAALDLVRSGWVDTLQVIFNLFDQSPAVRLFPLAQEHRSAAVRLEPPRSQRAFGFHRHPGDAAARARGGQLPILAGAGALGRGHGTREDPRVEEKLL